MTLDEAVLAVVEGGVRGAADETIVAAGPAGAERLARALAESPLATAVMAAEGGYNGGRFERVLDVLDRIDWPGLAGAMTVYLRSPRDRVRERVAELLGARGDVPAMNLVARAMGERVDDALTRGALEGAGRAVKLGRATAMFRAVLFERVARDLLDPGPRMLRYPVMSDAERMLMTFDPRRGAEVLTRPPVLSAENPNLDRALFVIDEFRLPLEPAALRGLLPGLRSASAVRAALSRLARAGPPDAVEPLLREHLRHEDPDVRSDAFSLLLAAKGINLFRLTLAQGLRTSLRRLHGLHQVLGVMSGDGVLAALVEVPRRQWKGAIELLRKAGAPEAAGAMERALAFDDDTSDEEAEALDQLLFDDRERVHEKVFALLEREGF